MIPAYPHLVLNMGQQDQQMRRVERSGLIWQVLLVDRSVSLHPNTAPPKWREKESRSTLVVRNQPSKWGSLTEPMMLPTASRRQKVYRHQNMNYQHQKLN